MNHSRLRSHAAPGTRALVLDAASIQDQNILADLSDRMGITVALDAVPPANMPGGIPSPLRFLQEVLPGIVRVLTTPRKIDELIGVDAVGRWEDEQVIVKMMESLGLAQPYTDISNIPLANYNPGYDQRTIVRFEAGLRVGPLEEARTSAADIDARAEKRLAALMSLDIARNEVGFFGFNAGDNRTFGILNDPGLPPFVTVPAGAGGDTEWSTKTFDEVISDIRLLLELIRTRSGDNVDPNTAAITLALPTSAMGALGLIGAGSSNGFSVQAYLDQTFRNVRIVSVPQFEDANGGESVAMAWADAAPEGDGSTDNGRTWMQLVPERGRLLGSEQGAKHYVEDHTNATAGVLLKRPILVAAISGV